MAETQHKPKRKRSPSYPGYGLEACVDKAKAVFDVEHEHDAPMEALAEHWGAKQTSSSFTLWIAALKQFGLLDEMGAGDKRRFKVSDSALDILTYADGHPKRIAGLKAAALLPKIHAELWSKYSDNLPSDQNIRTYLIRERTEGTFNKAHVDGFIAQYRATLAYAGLIDDDTTHEEGNGENLEPDMDNSPPPARRGGTGAAQQPPPAHNFQNPRRPLPPTPPGMKEDSCSLNEGPAVLRWPETLSQESAADLRDWLQLVLKRVGRLADATE